MGPHRGRGTESVNEPAETTSCSTHLKKKKGLFLLSLLFEENKEPTGG